jgi:hypothetical protein
MPESGLLLQQAGLEGMQGNVLLVKHPALDWPQSRLLERGKTSFDRAIHLDLGTAIERFSGLSCRTSELPFMEASFRRVVLWHVIATGEEAELAEALRVLATGGELLVLGIQQRARSLSVAGPEDAIPRLQRMPLMRCLREAGMEIVSVTGSGLPIARNWPIRRPGPAGVLLPFASLVLVRARHGNPGSPSLQRLDSFRARMARTTEAAALFVQ